MQGILWASFTAPLQGPDEDQHAAYVQLVAETGHGPKRNEGTGAHSTALSRALAELGLGPMLQHPEARPYWSLTERVQHSIDDLPDSARSDGTGPNAVAQNPPLYYLVGAVAYHLSPDRSLLGRLFAVRLITVAMYLLTVAFTWLLASEIFTRLWQRFLATALVVLQPKLVAMGAVINPDTLLFAVSTGFLWLAVRTLRQGLGIARAAGLACFAGAGALTHGRGLFLIGSLVIVLILAVIRFRPSVRTTGILALVSGGILAAFVVSAVAWTQAASGGAAFGGEVTQSGSANVRQFISYVFQFYFGQFSSLQPLGPPYGYRQAFIETFFGGFGSLEVTYRPAIYDQLQIAAGVGIAAFVICVAARWSDVIRLWWLWAFAVTFFVCMLTLLHITAYRDLLVGGDPLITGRYLLPAVGLYGVGAAWVVGSLKRSIRAPVAAVLLSSAVALSVHGFLVLDVRFYG